VSGGRCRRRREQVAVNLELARAEGDSVWSSLVPVLDEALLELREPDLLALILHFMEGRTFHKVGSALGVGEDTARKRVHRCLGHHTVNHGTLEYARGDSRAGHYAQLSELFQTTPDKCRAREGISPRQRSIRLQFAARRICSALHLELSGIIGGAE
jgi:hypothetical protein